MNGFAWILKSFPVFRIFPVYILMRISLPFKHGQKFMSSLLVNKLQIYKASDHFYDGLGTQSWKADAIVKCRSSVDDNLIYRNDSSIFNKISPTIENFIADMAIATCAFYNDELQKHGFSSNIVYKTWMNNFLNYKEKNGFVSAASNTILTSEESGVHNPNEKDNNGNVAVDGSALSLTWHHYIEQMVSRDPLEIRVITTPSKGMYPVDSPMRMQYYQYIEPRKLANKILELYSTIAKELLVDLSHKSAERDTEEIINYANNANHHGTEYAEKNRKPHRLSYEDNDENGTPFREKNRMKFETLATKFALSALQEEWVKSAHGKVLHQYMNEFIHNLTQSAPAFIDGYKASDKGVIQDRYYTRMLFETLYSDALRQSIITYTPHVQSQQQQLTGTDIDTLSTAARTGTQINLLKLVQDLLNTRNQIINMMHNCLNTQENTVRYYFNLIKENGGFKRLELPRRPKYEVIDLSQEALLLKQEKIYFIKEEKQQQYQNNNNNKDRSASSKSNKDETVIEDDDDDADAMDMFIIPIPGTDVADNIMFL